MIYEHEESRSSLDINIKTNSLSQRIILAVRQIPINTMKAFIVLAVVIVAGTLYYSIIQKCKLITLLPHLRNFHNIL